jgi:hypothetical protein
MSQSTTLPPSDKKMNSEVVEERKTFPNTIPPQVVLEIIDTNKRAVSTFVSGRVTAWKALPLQRKRFLALFSLSALLSVTISFIAMALARRLTRKRATKTAL